MKSTKDELREAVGAVSPNKAIQKVTAARGGLMNSKSAGKLPLRQQQIYNKNQKRKLEFSPSNGCTRGSGRNLLYVIMQQCKLTDKIDRYIQEVTCAPEPMAILATQQQLFDLEWFCCGNEEFCVMGVYPTFKLGDFSVTPIVDQHFLVKDKSLENLLKNIEGIHREGLVDCTRNDEFYAMLSELKDTWLQREPSSSTTETIYDWFIKFKAGDFCSSTVRPLREAAGLGKPPAGYFTNPNESINSALKNKTNYKKPAFVKLMREFVTKQQEEVEKAVIGGGNIPYKYLIKSLKLQMTKAKELLANPNAISTVPGGSDKDKFVLFKSGTTPHLVKQFSKSCSLKNGELQPYLFCYDNLHGKRPVNLFQAAKHDMPPGAGCKGRKPNCVRSRKSRPITKYIALSPSMLQNSIQSVSACVSPPTVFLDHIVTPTAAASPIASNPIYPNTFSPSSLNETPATWNPIAVCSPIFPKPPMPFKLVFTSGNISVCQGCRQRFPRSTNGSIIDAPYNIVIRHEESCSFQNPTTKIMQTKSGNAYYHAYSNGIQSKWPHFNGLQVEIDETTEDKLSQSHRANLLQFGTILPL
uniref:Uncharacterized protein n=1 Tax=Amphimedon queenslandica TaxID=400682 RepID=A0A1X7V9K3_AMPQE